MAFFDFKTIFRKLIKPYLGIISQEIVIAKQMSWIEAATQYKSKTILSEDSLSYKYEYEYQDDTKLYRNKSKNGDKSVDIFYMDINMTEIYCSRIKSI